MSIAGEREIGRDVDGAIAGLCVGLAAPPPRPVGEIQFMGFIYAALDRRVNHATRLRTRPRTLERWGSSDGRRDASP